MLPMGRRAWWYITVTWFIMAKNATNHKQSWEIHTDRCCYYSTWNKLNAFTFNIDFMQFEQSRYESSGALQQHLKTSAQKKVQVDSLHFTLLCEEWRIYRRGSKSEKELMTGKIQLWKVKPYQFFSQLYNIMAFSDPKNSYVQMVRKQITKHNIFRSLVLLPSLSQFEHCLKSDLNAGC